MDPGGGAILTLNPNAGEPRTGRKMPKTIALLVSRLYTARSLEAMPKDVRSRDNIRFAIKPFIQHILPTCKRRGDYDSNFQ
jgi:hypothetical protein